jgi:hypothetical protein
VSYGEPARIAIHRPRLRRIRVAGLLVVIAAIAAVLGYRVLASPTSTTAAPVDGLRSDLLGAVRQAATDAARDGVVLHIDSGWRSPEYQQQLFDEAVAKYGSAEEASRWVASPQTSAHVSGRAVDIGPPSAAAWLSQHGAAYGLCQIYRNEPWHYELRPDAIGHGCPPMYADATHDPRMQR